MKHYFHTLKLQRSCGSIGVASAKLLSTPSLRSRSCQEMQRNRHKPCAHLVYQAQTWEFSAWVHGSMKCSGTLFLSRDFIACIQACTLYDSESATKIRNENVESLVEGASTIVASSLYATDVQVGCKKQWLMLNNDQASTCCSSVLRPIMLFVLKRVGLFHHNVSDSERCSVLT